MSVDPVDRAELSEEGSLRRDAILAALRARAQDRRRGRAVLAGGGAALGCLALLAGAVLITRDQQIPSNHSSHPGPPIVNSGTQTHPAPTPLSAPDPEPTIRVTIVTNDTLPSAPCLDTHSAETSGTPGTPNTPTAAVCLLSDAQLLRLLDRDGETYGLVRVGGRATVVANSAQR